MGTISGYKQYLYWTIKNKFIILFACTDGLYVQTADSRFDIAQQMQVIKL